MRKVILLLGLVLQVIIVDAQSVSGSLVDEKGNPVSFANGIAIFQRFIFVQGTISNEQGIFSIDQTSGNNILRILSWLYSGDKSLCSISGNDCDA